MMPRAWAGDKVIEYTARCPVCGIDCLFTSAMMQVDRTANNANGQAQSRIYTEIQTTESCACGDGETK